MPSRRSTICQAKALTTTPIESGRMIAASSTICTAAPGPGQREGRRIADDKADQRHQPCDLERVGHHPPVERIGEEGGDRLEREALWANDAARQQPEQRHCIDEEQIGDRRHRQERDRVERSASRAGARVRRRHEATPSDRPACRSTAKLSCNLRAGLERGFGKLSSLDHDLIACSGVEVQLDLRALEHGVAER